MDLFQIADFLREGRLDDKVNDEAGRFTGSKRRRLVPLEHLNEKVLSELRVPCPFYVLNYVLNYIFNHVLNYVLNYVLTLGSFP